MPWQALEPSTACQPTRYHHHGDEVARGALSEQDQLRPVPGDEKRPRGHVGGRGGVGGIRRLQGRVELTETTTLFTLNEKAQVESGEGRGRRGRRSEGKIGGTPAGESGGSQRWSFLLESSDLDRATHRHSARGTALVKVSMRPTLAVQPVSAHRISKLLSFHPAS
eukprot:2544915-Rhodomonas_salina.2